MPEIDDIMSHLPAVIMTYLSGFQFLGAIKTYLSKNQKLFTEEMWII